MPKVELPDMKPFENALRLGIAKTFRKAVNDHAPEFVYGFCIYTDDDARSLVCIVSTLEALADQRIYYSTSGCPYDHAGYQTLRTAQRLLNKAWNQYMNGPAELYDWDDDRYRKLTSRFKESVFKAMLSAMHGAKCDGAFGTIAERRRRFIIFDITDSQRAQDNRVAWSRRLNVPSVANAYARSNRRPRRLLSDETDPCCIRRP